MLHLCTCPDVRSHTSVTPSCILRHIELASDAGEVGHAVPMFALSRQVSLTRRAILDMALSLRKT